MPTAPSPAGWRVRLLGGFQLEYNGTPAPRLPTRKTAALLAWLVRHPNRPFSRDFLADMFWSDCDADAARNSLRVALNALRKVLLAADTDSGEAFKAVKSGILEADRTTIQLAAGTVSSDVADFEKAIQEDRRAAAGHGDIALLERAAELYRGPFLAGWYEDWIEAERIRLAEMNIGLLLRLGDLLVQRGQTAAGVAYAERAVAADPVREDSHRRLIRLLLRADESDAARRQFERLEQILRDTCGAVPSLSTRELVKQPIRTPPSKSASVSSDTMHRFPDLPLLLTPFYGRESERQTIGAAAVVPPGAEPRLITLTGPGGVGKSRLALEVAAELRDTAYAGRAAFVPLNGSQIPAQIAATLATILNLPLAPEDDSTERLIQALSGPPTLLVLDEFESVEPTGIAWFHELQQRLPRVTFIVTSRHRLHLDGEQEYDLSPLEPPSPEIHDTAILETYPSIALFVDRARAARPDFHLNSDNADAVVALCARLDGLPLAIELAAAWNRVLTPPQILDRLTARFDLLVKDSATGAERHRSLRAVMEESVGLLPDSARGLFERLSVFQGGWDLEAVEPVCDVADAVKLLAILHERSLILTQDEETGRRFRMLETVREYAAGLLIEEETSEAQRRHAVYFGQWADEARVMLNGLEAAQWLRRLDAERANIRTACRTALEREDLDLATACVRGFWRYWYARGISEPGLAFIESLLRRADQRGKVLHPEVAEVAGRLALSLGHIVRARGWLEASLVGFQRMSLSERRVTEVATDVALAAQTLGDYPGACAAYSLVLSEKRRAGDLWGAAWCLMEMGKATERDDGSEASSPYFRESAELRHRVGDAVGAEEVHLRAVHGTSGEDATGGPALSTSPRALYIAHAYLSLGHTASEQGDFGAAIPLLRDAVTAYRETHDLPGVALALERLGLAFLRCGAISQARSSLEEAAALRADGERPAGDFVRILLAEVSEVECRCYPPGP